MKPVTQIRTGYGCGQCTEASIASLLEVPLDAVPDLWAGPDAADPQPHENRVRMWEWLKREHGVMLCGVNLAPFADIRSAWSKASSLIPIPLYSEEWDRFHVACGPNPDGVEHMVVCELGGMRHDPNPSRRGIVACNWIGWLVPLHLVPADAQHLPSAEWQLPS